LEAYLVKAARTRLLALVAAATGFTQARTNAPPDTPPGVLGAGCRLERIQLNGVFHCYSFRLPTRRPNRPPCGSCHALPACRPALCCCSRRAGPARARLRDATRACRWANEPA